MINFKCPQCGEALSVPESLAGKSEKCPGCGKAAIVPSVAVSRGPEARVLVKCPQCAAAYRAPASAAGKHVRCPDCGRKLVIPAGPTDGPASRPPQSGPPGSHHSAARRAAGAPAPLAALAAGLVPETSIIVHVAGTSRAHRGLRYVLVAEGDALQVRPDSPGDGEPFALERSEARSMITVGGKGVTLTLPPANAEEDGEPMVLQSSRRSELRNSYCLDDWLEGKPYQPRGVAMRMARERTFRRAKWAGIIQTVLTAFVGSVAIMYPDNPLLGGLNGGAVLVLAAVTAIGTAGLFGRQVWAAVLLATLVVWGMAETLGVFVWMIVKVLDPTAWVNPLAGVWLVFRGILMWVFFKAYAGAARFLIGRGKSRQGVAVGIAAATTAIVATIALAVLTMPGKERQRILGSLGAPELRQRVLARLGRSQPSATQPTASPQRGRALIRELESGGALEVQGVAIGPARTWTCRPDDPSMEAAPRGKLCVLRFQLRAPLHTGARLNAEGTVLVSPSGTIINPWAIGTDRLARGFRFEASSAGGHVSEMSVMDPLDNRQMILCTGCDKAIITVQQGATIGVGIVYVLPVEARIGEYSLICKPVPWEGPPPASQ